LAAGWTEDGVALPGTTYSDAPLLPDGAGGVVAIGPYDRPWVQHIDGDGARHAGWPVAGIPLTFPPPPFSSFIVFDTRLLPSGPDHGLALWSNGSSQGARTLYAQRFRLDDGALDPGWPAGGVVVIPPDPLTGLAVFTDGSG